MCRRRRHVSRTLALSDAGLEHLIASASAQNAVALRASPSIKQQDASLSLRATIKCEAILGNTRCEPMMSLHAPHTRRVRCASRQNRARKSTRWWDALAFAAWQLITDEDTVLDGRQRL